MKKVIRIFVSVFVFLNLCMSFAQFAHSASWSIDSSHTSVAFKIRHLGVSWVRGEFRSFNGQVEYDPKKISKTKISLSNFNIITKIPKPNKKKYFSENKIYHKILASKKKSPK